MDSGFAGRRKQIEAALLDYQHSPGKYPLLLRRPEILFSSVRDVLLLASGRLPADGAPPRPEVQRAACFFVRTALLYPAADHYALLGLDRCADAAAVKERYRQMMRLMHPDFAGSSAAGSGWPADAASRINQAYEVLASDPRRRSYDEKLHPAAAPAPRRMPGMQPVAQLKAAASAPAPDPRRLLKRMAGAFGVLGAVALAASLLARGPDRESLVQRATPRPSPAVAMPAQSDPLGTSITALVEPERRTEPAPGPSAAPPAMREAPATTGSPLFEPLQRTAAAPMPAAMQMAQAAPPPALVFAVSAEAPAPQAAIRAAVPAAPHMAQGATDSPAVPPVAVQPRPIAPAVTMAEAHALLSTLLQQMESGSGERMLSGLDRAVRNAPSSQALARQYNSLVDGSRSVKISNVLLKADPRADRLFVRGQVLLDIGDFGNTRAGELALEAEFAKRDGAVVMTRLAPAQPRGPATQ